MHLRFTVSGIFLLLMILCMDSRLSAQELHTYTDIDSVRVGDFINYTLVLNTSEEYGMAAFPDESHFDDQELVFINRERYRISAMQDSVVYTLQNFNTDDFQIPRLPVNLSGGAYGDTTLYSTPVPVFFKTIVTEGDEEFRPLKPIFDFAAAIWPWILGIVLTLIAAWFIYRYLQIREKKELKPEKEFKPIPFQNPLNTLKKELDTLSGSDSPLKSRNYKEFYVLLGDAIRQYFEDVYDIDALEMTSGEILKNLHDYPADKEIIKITRKVLNEADMVKFAKFEPDVPQAEKALEIAYQFLNVVTEIDNNRIKNLQNSHMQKEQERKEELNSELGQS
jgi:hypothetical protein